MTMLHAHAVTAGYGARRVLHACTLSLAFGACMTATLFIGAPALATFFRMDSLVTVARGLSFIFMIQSLGVVAESLLQREMQFRKLAAIELAAYAVGYGGVGITLAVMHLGAWALVAAQMTQSIVKMSLLPSPVRSPSASGPVLDACPGKRSSIVLAARSYCRTMAPSDKPSS